MTALLDREAERYGDSLVDWPVIVVPTPMRKRRQKGAGERRGLTGMVRCSGCGQWIRPRPEIGDVEAAERAYSGDEWQEHYCPADFGDALDLASEEEREAWEALIGEVDEV